MEQKRTVSVAALPQVRVLGRTTGTDVVNLFWTGSGIEFIYTGSELQVEVNADYDAYEPWLAVELNGVQISRVPLNKGKNEACTDTEGSTGNASGSRASVTDCGIAICRR